MEKTKKIYMLTGHILAWSLVIGVPLIFMLQDSNMRAQRFVEYVLHSVLYLFVFYINYCYLIDKYIYKRKVLKFLLINLLIILACLAIQYLVKEFLAPDKIGVPQPNTDLQSAVSKPRKMHRPPFIFRYFWNFLPLILVAGLSVAFKATRHWYRVESERNELQNKQVTAELANLKNQLNPHFLFNTLNNIYSLVAINADKAQDAIHRLSNLLRYLLYDNNQTFVPLNKDIDFTKSFIELMQLRLSKNVELTTDINYGDDADKIAPLLFISIIENAFKHGVNPMTKSFIDIKIVCVPHKSATCIVRNSYFPKSENDKSGSGIGRENTRRRLELLYEGKYVWNMKIDDNVYEATLSVNFN